MTLTKLTAIATVALLFLCAQPGAASNVTKCPAEKQHPTIFLPGLFFSMLDVHLTGIPESIPLPHETCARQNKKFATMWAKTKYLKSEQYDCITEYMKMEFDPVTGVGHNRPGIEIQPTRFGSTYGVEKLDPDDFVGITYMYHKMVKALKKRGFTANNTLYGAPYDWRLIPTANWTKQFVGLIESAYAKTGRKVVIVAHSMGCILSHQVLVTQGEAWCKKFIEHWYPISPPWTGSPLAMYFTLVNGTDILKQYLAPTCDVFRDIEAMYYLSPKHQFGLDVPIATSDKHVYTPRNITELFGHLGLPYTTAVFKRAQAAWDAVAYKHPGIPTTVIYSLGVKTLAMAKFAKDEDIGKGVPTPKFADGDGLVTKESLMAYTNVWLNDPRYAQMTDTYEVVGKLIYHGNTFKDDGAMELIYKTVCS